jgi:ATP-dependent DNA helicase DinG
MKAQPGAWIFTSATLAVGSGVCEHFAARLGVARITRRYGWTARSISPGMHSALSSAGIARSQVRRTTQRRCWKRSCRCWRPAGAGVSVVHQLPRLREAAAWLAGRLPYPLLVQGASAESGVAATVSQLGNAVLLGTASFWEGVDVRGEALSCVMIDRLPFAAPGDPVVQARIESLRQRGETRS